VYLLRSESDCGFYIGFSTNLRGRLRQHQDGESFATKSRGPWKLIYYEAYTEREDAEGREKFLKRGAGLRLKLGRFPHSLAASLAALPSMSLIPFAPLKLVRCPRSLAPTLVALPSMSRVPRAPFLRTQLRHYLRVKGFASRGLVRLV